MATKDWNGFKKSGDTYIPNDATARADIAAIKDGTNIDSFGDVETALAGKQNAFTANSPIAFVQFEDELILAIEADQKPTKNSNALLESGTIYDAIDDVYKTNGMLGAKNLFSTNNIASGANLVTITDKGKAINVKNTTEGTYQMVKFDMPVEKNTDYIFTVDIDYISGAGEIIISNTAENNVLARINTDVTADRQWTATFNTGELTNIRFRMYCTRATSETGEFNYNNALLRLATDPDDTYVPYAMTNRELTEKVQGIIDVATNAADFAAFKTAIGNL